MFCGPSGSGKSSLAMDTLYAEGQRRYVESLSAYARQFLGQMPKPKVEHVHGLSPAIAIEQKTVGSTPRSTVGTVTEVYDYLRVLFARLGQMHCPDCGSPVTRQTTDEIVAGCFRRRMARGCMWPLRWKFPLARPTRNCGNGWPRRASFACGSMEKRMRSRTFRRSIIAVTTRLRWWWIGLRWTRKCGAGLGTPWRRPWIWARGGAHHPPG